MVVADLENLRIRVPPAIQAKLNEMCDQKRVSKQDLIAGALAWLLDQDDLLVSMIVGQVAPRPDLAELVLRRLMDKAHAGKPLREPRVLRVPKQRTDDRHS